MLDLRSINRKRTRIGIFAGGGVFGAIPSFFFSKYFGDSPINEYFDVLGGTSVGSELATAFACEVAPNKLYNEFVNAVPEIFKKSFWPTVSGAKYDNSVLKKFLQGLVPASYGKLKTTLIVPVKDFENNKFKVYDNIIADSDCQLPGWVPCLQSSCAPTYFDPYDGCIDGGIMENIPIMTTIMAVKHKLGIDFKDMSVLVMGTGFKCHEKKDMKKVKKWYVWQWLKPMLGELTEANEQASMFWARQLELGYLSFFNPVELDKGWEMDDASVVGKVTERCEKHVGDFRTEIEKFLTA